MKRWAIAHEAGEPLGPEEWKKLDAARLAFQAFPGGQELLDLEDLLVLHHHVLIDAARPKCERCKGSGSWPRVTRQCCPDCNGTGWAA